MYSTCLFCHVPLGANEALERFPVGRLLAFDGERGRLWVVCGACGRWNLSPIEERWEAIEQAERLFRGERLRTQTEQVGLARLREGTELVRIGRPMRPEFAAWRYGSRFGARRRQAVLRTAAGVTAGAAALGGSVALALATPAMLLATPAVWMATNLAWPLAQGLRDYGRAIRAPGPGGSVLTLYRAGLRETELAPADDGQGWSLRLRHVRGLSVLRGEDARRALSVLMTRVNSVGGGARQVRGATDLLVERGGPEGLIRRVAEESARRAEGYDEKRARFRRNNLDASASAHGRPSSPPVNDGALTRFSARERLALEMAVHEASEQRALEGEMAALEHAWREAEEIAAIADHLLVPAEVEEKVRRMKDGTAVG